VTSKLVVPDGCAFTFVTRSVYVPGNTPLGSVATMLVFLNAIKLSVPPLNTTVGAFPVGLKFDPEMMSWFGVIP